MHISLTSILFLASLSLAQDGGPCLIYGPDFVAPKHPSQDQAVTAAVAKIKDAIVHGSADTGLYGPISLDGASFSVDIFSVYEDESIFTYHNTAPSLRNGTLGVKEVDSNSIYRVGSISKLLTVYMYLLAAGDVTWNRPVTDFIPELAHATAVNPSNQIDSIDWKSITPGALASQLAGLPRVNTQSPAGDAVYGLPDQWPMADGSDSNLCGIDGYFNVPCNRSQFFESFLQRPPVVAPFETAVYSNSAFAILGYVLEAITGKSLEDIFKADLVDRHQLDATSFGAPASYDSAVIPMNLTFSHFADDILTGAAFGGYTSSINDLRKIGRAILNSTYLSPAQTQRWFKPHSFNYDPRGAIGAPWEMVRAPSTEKLTWVYTKGGDYGDYSSLVGYIPEYGVGFSILTAWTDKSGTLAANDLGNLMVALLPAALEQAAKDESAVIYSGTYTDVASNSSMVVETDAFGGMNLAKWTQNGTNVRSKYLTDFNLLDTDFTRLVPTGLVNRDNGQVTAVNFRLLVGKAIKAVDTQPVTSLCFFWVEPDALTYGRFGLDSITFQHDAEGNAIAASAPAFRTRLAKEA